MHAILNLVQFSSSVMSDCETMDYSMPGFPVLRYPLELAQTHVHWVNGAIQSSLSSVAPFSSCLQSKHHQGIFQWVGSSYQVAKVLELHLQYQSFQWILLLIYFRLVWFDLLAVQGTLKSLPKCHSLKASVLRHSALFVAQLCTSLGFCFPSSWIPSGCTAGHGHRGWWLQHPLSTDQADSSTQSHACWLYFSWSPPKAGLLPPLLLSLLTEGAI